jgi:2-C-methyl-D-erythritol 2,4-cyclodiphosphate synthase
MGNVRTGIGFDAHRFAGGRPLFLGGIRVDYEYGLAGHSDADVLIHALIDAMLGSIGEGDIGQHFPPGDPEFKDISSSELLERTVRLVDSAGFCIGNADLVLIGERPRIRDYIPDMRNKLAGLLGIIEENVSVKATTTEGMGFTGRGEGLGSMAVVTVERREGKDQEI